MISLKVPKGREFCTSQSSLSTVGWLYLFRKVPWEAETRFFSSIGFDFVPPALTPSWSTQQSFKYSEKSHILSFLTIFRDLR